MRANALCLGSIVITGATSVADGNRVFYLFKSIAPRFDDTSTVVTRDRRYAQRLAHMLSRVGEPVVIKKKRGRKRGAKMDKRTGKVIAAEPIGDDMDEEDDESDQEDEEAMHLAVTQVLRMHHPSVSLHDLEKDLKQTRVDDASPEQSSGDAQQITSLMTAAERGNLTLVRSLLQMGLQDAWAVDGQGRTAHDRLQHFIEQCETEGRTVNVAHREILNLLHTHMLKTQLNKESA